MFCVWMQRNLFRIPSLSIFKNHVLYHNHVYVTIKLHASFKAELGPERPSSWDPTRMGKTRGRVDSFSSSSCLSFGYMSKWEGAVLTFTLIMFPKWLIMILAVRKSWKLLRHRVIRAAKKPMTCSFTCVSPPKHWADASEQPCVWICYSLACQTKEVAVPQRDWFASELPAEVLLKLSCSWFKIHWCNNPFGYGWLWLC